MHYIIQEACWKQLCWKQFLSRCCKQERSQRHHRRDKFLQCCLRRGLRQQKKMQKMQNEEDNDAASEFLDIHSCKQEKCCCRILSLRRDQGRCLCRKMLFQLTSSLHIQESRTRQKKMQPSHLSSSFCSLACRRSGEMHHLQQLSR